MIFDMFIKWLIYPEFFDCCQQGCVWLIGWGESKEERKLLRNEIF